MEIKLNFCLLLAIVFINGLLNYVTCNDNVDGDSEGDGIIVADVEEEQTNLEEKPNEEISVEVAQTQVSDKPIYDPYVAQHYQRFPNVANNQYHYDPSTYALWPYYDNLQQYQNPRYNLWYQQQQWANTPYAYSNQWAYHNMPYYPSVYNTVPSYPSEQYNYHQPRIDMPTKSQSKSETQKRKKTTSQTKSKPETKSTAEIKSKPETKSTAETKSTKSKTASCHKGEKYLEGMENVPCPVKTQINNNNISNNP